MDLNFFSGIVSHIVVGKLCKNQLWPETSVIDDRRHEAKINFGRAA